MAAEEVNILTGTATPSAIPQDPRQTHEANKFLIECRWHPRDGYNKAYEAWEIRLMQLFRRYAVDEQWFFAGAPQPNAIQTIHATRTSEEKAALHAEAVSHWQAVNS